MDILRHQIRFWNVGILYVLFKGGRRSRAHVDLRAVISSKERSGREEQRESRDRERASTTGDLRDRLEKNRVQIDFEDFDPVMKGENCDISELGKQKLLSMFLDGNNPVKDLKGKENEKSDDPSEIVKKATILQMPRQPGPCRSLLVVLAP